MIILNMKDKYIIRMISKGHKTGPIISIFGDTKPCQSELSIAKDSDVMIHEATYIEGEKTLANNYHHSHIEDVLN